MIRAKPIKELGDKVFDTTEIDKIFDAFVNTTKVYRDKLNHDDSLMFLCDIATLKRHIIESENNMCVEHGYSFPCPFCGGKGVQTVRWNSFTTRKNLIIKLSDKELLWFRMRIPHV
jgi:hypothetical protein